MTYAPPGTLSELSRNTVSPILNLWTEMTSPHVGRNSCPYLRELFMGRAVILVPVTTAAFWSWACAQRQQGVAAEQVLGSSQGFPGWRQGFPGWRSVAYQSGAASGLDWRRAGPQFAPARQDPPLCDAPARGRWTEWQAVSGRPPRAPSAQPLRLAPAGMAEQQGFRDRQAASSGPNSRSSALSLATSQAPELLRRLFAGYFAVRLPSQGGCNTDTNRDQIAGETSSRASPFHLIFYC